MSTGCGWKALNGFVEAVDDSGGRGDEPRPRLGYLCCVFDFVLTGAHTVFVCWDCTSLFSQILQEGQVLMSAWECVTMPADELGWSTFVVTPGSNVATLIGG